VSNKAISNGWQRQQIDQRKIVGVYIGKRRRRALMFMALVGCSAIPYHYTNFLATDQAQLKASKLMNRTVQRLTALCNRFTFS